MEKFGTHAKPLYFALKMSMGTKKTKKKTILRNYAPQHPPIVPEDWFFFGFFGTHAHFSM
jgi:hypothetical protein